VGVTSGMGVTGCTGALAGGASGTAVLVLTLIAG
jgi:hypothetical protein